MYVHVFRPKMSIPPVNFLLRPSQTYFYPFYPSWCHNFVCLVLYGFLTIPLVIFWIKPSQTPFSPLLPPLPLLPRDSRSHNFACCIDNRHDVWVWYCFLASRNDCTGFHLEYTTTNPILPYSPLIERAYTTLERVDTSLEGAIISPDTTLGIPPREACCNPSEDWYHRRECW